jgi:hypothetical protein
MRPFIALIAFSILTAIIPPAAADSLGLPKGRVILEISGKITQTNKGATAVFDAAMLENLGERSLIITNTPWTEGEETFSGLSLKDLLDLIGADGEVLQFTSLNDNVIDIPIDDARSFDMLLAMKRNGTRMRIRDRGPIWVVYPWNDRPELATDEYYSRSIWQVRSLEVR